MRQLGALGVCSVVVASTLSAEEPKLTATLRQAIATNPSAIQVAWVFFTDKGPEATASSADSVLTERARSRRALRGQATDPAEDLPVAASYVEAVRTRALRVRHESRWFNAVSVEATPSQLVELAQLPFVARVDLVRRMDAARP